MLTIFAKSFILDVWQGSQYAFVVDPFVKHEIGTLRQVSYRSMRNTKINQNSKWIELFKLISQRCVTSNWYLIQIYSTKYHLYAFYTSEWSKYKEWCLIGGIYCEPIIFLYVTCIIRLLYLPYRHTLHTSFRYTLDVLMKNEILNFKLLGTYK